MTEAPKKASPGDIYSDTFNTEQTSLSPYLPVTVVSKGNHKYTRIFRHA